MAQVTTLRAQISANPITVTLSVDQTDILIAILQRTLAAHPELTSICASMGDLLTVLQQARKA